MMTISPPDMVLFEDTLLVVLSFAAGLFPVGSGTSYSIFCVRRPAERRCEGCNRARIPSGATYNERSVLENNITSQWRRHGERAQLPNELRQVRSERSIDDRTVASG